MINVLHNVSTPNQILQRCYQLFLTTQTTFIAIIMKIPNRNAYNVCHFWLIREVANIKSRDMAKSTISKVIVLFTTISLSGQSRIVFSWLTIRSIKKLISPAETPSAKTRRELFLSMIMIRYLMVFQNEIKHSVPHDNIPLHI